MDAKRFVYSAPSPRHHPPPTRSPSFPMASGGCSLSLVPPRQPLLPCRLPSGLDVAMAKDLKFSPKTIFIAEFEKP
ncbi:hypothetical protein U9M48_000368, partial [Paspalum notatum var. saurae]